MAGFDDATTISRRGGASLTLITYDGYCSAAISLVSRVEIRVSFYARVEWRIIRAIVVAHADIDSARNRRSRYRIKRRETFDGAPSFRKIIRPRAVTRARRTCHTD